MSEVRTYTGPYFVNSEIEIDTVNGASTVETWEGTYAECNTKKTGLLASGATKVRLSPKGDGAWQVRGTFPYDTSGSQQASVDTLELEVNAVQRSAYQSPIYRSYFSDYSTVTRNSAKALSTLPIIADCARKYAAGLPARESNGTYIYGATAYNTRELAILAESAARFDLLSTLTTGEKVSATSFLNNVAFRGVTSFIEFNQVFRRTVTAANPSAISWNLVGAGKIWTSSEVIAYEGIPNNGWFTIPPDVQWFKDKPRVISAYNQKTQISYSYTEIVTASNMFYQAYGNAVLID